MFVHNLFSQNICGFCWFISCFNTFIPWLVQTSLERFFPVPVRFIWVWESSRTRPNHCPAIKGKKIWTGPYFKALAFSAWFILLTEGTWIVLFAAYPVSLPYQFHHHCHWLERTVITIMFRFILPNFMLHARWGLMEHRSNGQAPSL